MPLQPAREPLIRRRVAPVRIVWETEGKAALHNSAWLLNSRASQATLASTAVCVMEHKDAMPGICLDFGRELNGGIRIVSRDTTNHQPVRVRVRFGESVSEAMGAPCNDHAIHDGIFTVPWLGSVEIGNTGFRFVRIDLVDPGARLEIGHLCAVLVLRDLEYKGAFECSDPLLNRIWQTGAYTVHLNMQDLLWDGIKRDRLVWIGDMHPETKVISAVFGDVDVVRQSLDMVRDETPLPGFMNGISSYSLWWVIIHYDWYLSHGNRAYLCAQRPYLSKLLRIVAKAVDAQGRETLAGGRFLDWPSSNDEQAVHAGLHSLLILALEAGAELCRILGADSVRRICLSAIKRLRRHHPPGGLSKQANSLLVLAGLADAQQTNKEVLGVAPLKGVSTFYGYYLLQARAQAGDYVGCLDLIRKYWGGMLTLGATTFWEDFKWEWLENAGRIDEIVPAQKVDVHASYGDFCYKGLRHSLCHGWAAGPTAWLSEHLLGLKPLAPGCRKLAVRPHLAGLEWVRGSYPTPRGLVTVEHEQKRGARIKTKIKAPRRITLVAV